MKIAVGSTNPVKIAAARNVMRKIYPRAEIIAVAVNSGVSHNPLTDAETIAGAKKRARRARRLIRADLGLGLEGATVRVEGHLMTSGWVAVYDGKRYHLGGGGHTQLPPRAARRVLGGKVELGDAMDELTGGKNTKQRMGAIGILTKGLRNRQKAYEYILIYALAPLLTPEYYQDRQSKRRLLNSKFQITNYKQISNHKSQSPKRGRRQNRLFGDVHPGR